MQTPQFTFSTYPTDDDPRPRPPLPAGLPPILVRVKSGLIVECRIADRLHEEIHGKKLHEMRYWAQPFFDSMQAPGPIVRWISGMLAS